MITKVAVQQQVQVDEYVSYTVVIDGYSFEEYIEQVDEEPIMDTQVSDNVPYGF